MGVDWQHTTLLLNITMRCNFRCAHCCADSGPERMGEEMTVTEVLEYLRQFHARGGREVNFVGGEPTLVMDTLAAGVLFCASAGMLSLMTTNGWWGRADTAETYARRFRVMGLNALAVSYDTFHAPFQEWEDVKRAVRAARSAGVKAAVLWYTRRTTREAATVEMESLIGVVGARMVGEIAAVNSAVAVGRGKGLAPVKQWQRGECLWICQQIKTPRPCVTILPGGRLVFRCDAPLNEAMTFPIRGDFTELCDKLEDGAYYWTLRRGGLIPLMRKRKALAYHDQCEYCNAEMKDWATEVGILPQTVESEMDGGVQMAKRTSVPRQFLPPPIRAPAPVRFNLGALLPKKGRKKQVRRRK